MRQAENDANAGVCPEVGMNQLVMKALGQEILDKARLMLADAPEVGRFTQVKAEDHDFYTTSTVEFDLGPSRIQVYILERK